MFLVNKKNPYMTDNIYNVKNTDRKALFIILSKLINFNSWYRFESENLGSETKR